ncbi:MAG: response regulator [Burkholderiaceae bacterium]|nr:response regulator [Burkholderiaceae bacterium]
MAIFNKQALESITAKEMSNAAVHSVMIVDDKAANLSVMAAILRPHYHLLEAHNAQEALALIEEYPDRESLACILSDYRMPIMTGVDFLERAKQLLPLTSRVIVTGYIDVDAIIDSINKAEIHRFIVKPFDASDFLAAIESAVQAYEKRRGAVNEKKKPEDPSASGAFRSNTEAVNLAQALKIIDGCNKKIESLTRELDAARARLEASGGPA